MTGVSIPTIRKGHQIEFGKSAARLRTTMFLLAACAALNATGFGIVIPVFARRLNELGYGAADLGLLTGSYALAQFVGAPILGRLADRIGRKPMIVLALAGQMLGNLGYVVLTDLAAIVATRFVQGMLEAGIIPAALAVVADRAPAGQRSRWLGVIIASAGGAFVLGPVVGGVLFDLAGFVGAFVASAGLAVMAILLISRLFSESLTPRLRNRNRLSRMFEAQSRPGFANEFPRPFTTFAILLLVVFSPTFALSYVEPQFMFFAFDSLRWSTVEVGAILGIYGLSLMLTQLVLGGISDGRFGRRWVIVFGLVAMSIFYWGITTLVDFQVVLVIAAITGIGQGLVVPAFDGFLLSIAQPHQRAWVMGLRTSAWSFGAVVGAGFAFMVSGRVEPAILFASAGAFILVVALIAALGLRAKTAPKLEIEVDAYRRRSAAAATTLRGLAIQSAIARLR